MDGVTVIAEKTVDELPAYIVAIILMFLVLLLATAALAALFAVGFGDRKSLIPNVLATIVYVVLFAACVFTISSLITACSEEDCKYEVYTVTIDKSVSFIEFTDKITERNEVK